MRAGRSSSRLGSKPGNAVEEAGRGVSRSGSSALRIASSSPSSPALSEAATPAARAGRDQRAQRRERPGPGRQQLVDSLGRDPGLGEPVLGKLVADVGRGLDRRRAAPGPRPRRSRSRSPRELRPRCRSRGSRRPARSPPRCGLCSARPPRTRTSAGSPTASELAYSLAPSPSSTSSRSTRSGAGPPPASTATAASPPNHGRTSASKSSRPVLGLGIRAVARVASSPPNTGSRWASSARGCVLVGVGIEVGVQVGERVARDELRGVVARRTAVAARELTRQVRHHRREQDQQQHRDPERGDQTPPRDHRERAPEASRATADGDEDPDQPPSRR